MNYMKKRRMFKHFSNDDDPLTGVANLFDLGLVFIVGLFLALMTFYNLTDFFSEQSEITIVKKNEKGQVEFITKKGKEIKIEKVTNNKIGGEEGRRLGIAYQLKDGRVIYVPEKDTQ